MKTWTQEEARNNFDSLLINALCYQEQIIELSNQQKVIMIAFEDYSEQKKLPLANWLIENMCGVDELSLPDR